jgi:ATP-dependent Clp protease ATP-binding subunit ClpC
MDLKQSTTGWPVEGSHDGVRYVFSGTFSAGRVRTEQAAKGIEVTLRLVLGIIAALGLLAVLYGYWVDFSDLGLGAPFAQRWYNLIFWFSALTDCYLFFLVAQKRLATTTSKLSFSTTAVVGDVDAYKLFTDEAKAAWNVFASMGKEKPSNSFSLLESLLAGDSAKQGFLRLGINSEDIISVLRGQGDRPGLASHDKELIDSLPFWAVETALRLRSNRIDSLLLLVSLIEHLPKEHPMIELLFKLGVDQETLEVIVIWVFNIRLISEEMATFRGLAKLKSDSEIDVGLTAVPTPYLDQFSEDLTTKAKYGNLPIALGREADVDGILNLLSEGRRNVVIKGEQGSGRSTVIHELAYRMVTEDVPKILQDKRLVKLELSGIVGSRVPAETVLVEALTEAEKSGNIVLVLEDVHTLAKATSGKGLSLLEILVSNVQESNLIVLSSTTIGDYSDYLARTLNFGEVFTSYELKELTPQAVTLACCIRASFLEGKYNVWFELQAIKEAITLSGQYFTDVGQPQSSIQLLTETATRIGNSTKEQKLITPDDIRKVVAEKTHVPESTFTQAEADKLLNLETELAQSIVGQKQAVTAVVEALQRARSGLSRGTRPIASFLFVGPTGVGKTELAKTLARTYFGSEEYFLRLDMSEYQGVDGIDKMLGSKNDTQDTMFVKHVKNFPFCLFLLDEFEKASRDVLNLFLQILEDGRITNARGETLKLANTIIIATSNAGTPDIQAGIRAGETLEQIRTKLFEQILMKSFAPELLNRFDGVILFTPLAPEEVQKITELQLTRLAKQLLDTKGIEFSYTPAAVAEIAQKAYDPLLGARPIRRYLQDNVETILAKLLLSQNPARGTKLTLDFQNSQFVIQ